MNFRALLLGIAVTALMPSDRVAAQPKAEVGFQSLFDGKTLTGWNVMNKAKFTAEDEVTTKTYDVVFSLAVGIADQDGASFGIYPVPADDFLQVRSAESIREMRIISITGSTIRVQELSGEKNIQLNISELESGVYFLKVSGDSSSKILRFVKN